MKANDVALWAGLSAFFANLVGIGIIDLVNGGSKAQIAAAVAASIAVAGGVYSKQRYEDAKKLRGDSGNAEKT